MISKVCIICNNEFGVKPYRKDIAFYCSSKCYHASTIGKSTWNKGIKTGIIPKTAFKKGVRFNPAGEFKKGQIPTNFKGERVGYYSLHNWVKRHKNKAYYCLFAKTSYSDCSGRFEWANLSRTYKRDLSDWIPLCAKHHDAYDRKGHWG